ncbi:decaprenyl-diphosphate synthase subunit 2, partial [Paragonimus westermani]
MSDGEYITDGPLIDLASLDWREDLLPFEQISVHPSCLPDPEPQPLDKQRIPGNLPPELAAEARWCELDLESLLIGANPCVAASLSPHRFFVKMQSKWFELITRAEKLLGGPPPFINLRSLLTSEAGFLAARARRLAASVDHPFFEVVRACLRGKSVTYQFIQPSSVLTEPRGTVTTGQRASNGLIILLIGQCHVGVAVSPTKLYSQHRSLAELFETIHLAITIHKSLIDPKSFNGGSLSASHHSGTSNDHNMMQDLEAGNKVATLTGDVLLASVSTTLASFHNAR